MVGVSQSTVQRVEAETPVVGFDKPATSVARRFGRPSKAEPFRGFLIAELAKEPGLMVLELLRRARQQGYAGGKSAWYALVKELRPERPRPLVRFEGLPGEFSQHDFGHVDVRFLDGHDVDEGGLLVRKRDRPDFLPHGRVGRPRLGRRARRRG